MSEDVTQADIERAEPFMARMEGWYLGKEHYGDVLIQAFAAHRQREIEDVVAWLWSDAKALCATGINRDIECGLAIKECADAIERGDHLAHQPAEPPRGDGRSCTCHPDDRPAQCQQKYALSDCLAAADGAGEETFASIIAWGDETFGPAEIDRIIERAWEEWQEMISIGSDVATEAADVIIVLLRMPGIAEAIQRKMTVNRARKWNLRGDGTGYHIKDGAGEDQP